MPARRSSAGGRCRAPPAPPARGVAAAARGGGHGRERAVGARAGAAVRGRARGRQARAGGDGAALPRLGRPRTHRLRLLPRELEPAQGTRLSPARTDGHAPPWPPLPPTTLTVLALLEFAGGSGILDGAV
jgi:hypothetical protein